MRGEERRRGENNEMHHGVRVAMPIAEYLNQE